MSFSEGPYVAARAEYKPTTLWSKLYQCATTPKHTHTHTYNSHTKAYTLWRMRRRNAIANSRLFMTLQHQGQGISLFTLRRIRGVVQGHGAVVQVRVPEGTLPLRL